MFLVMTSGLYCALQFSEHVQQMFSSQALPQKLCGFLSRFWQGLW